MLNEKKAAELEALLELEAQSKVEDLSAQLFEGSRSVKKESI